MSARISIEQQIADASRELALRKNVYPKRVSDRKMRQAEADLLIANMAAILDTLVWVRDHADIIHEVHARRKAS